MELSITVDINAPREIVWSILCDVERWHEWTPSITSIRRLDAGPLAEGSRARVRQPKLLPATWRVTEFDAGRSFTWVSSSPGVRAIGGHRLEPAANGCKATLSVTFAGLLGPLMARFMRGLTERYMQMEAQGLKARSEAPTPPSH